MKEDQNLIILILVGAGLFLFGIVLAIVLFVIVGVMPFRTVRVEPSSPPAVTSTPAKSCKVAGCSNQLCVGQDEDISSTCEWTEEYSCYSTPFAKCEIQIDGECGWTQSDDLKNCVGDARKKQNQN